MAKQQKLHTKYMGKVSGCAQIVQNKNIWCMNRIESTCVFVAAAEATARHTKKRFEDMLWVQQQNTPKQSGERGEDGKKLCHNRNHLTWFRCFLVVPECVSLDTKQKMKVRRQTHLHTHTLAAPKHCFELKQTHADVRTIGIVCRSRCIRMLPTINGMWRP